MFYSQDALNSFLQPKLDSILPVFSASHILLWLLVTCQMQRPLRKRNGVVASWSDWLISEVHSSKKLSSELFTCGAVGAQGNKDTHKCKCIFFNLKIIFSPFSMMHGQERNNGFAERWRAEQRCVDCGVGRFQGRWGDGREPGEEDLCSERKN